MLGGYGIVGGHIPLAAGVAFASQVPRRRAGHALLLRRGRGVSIGGFHEGLSLAALWKLPIVFICENNEYSMGTPLSRSMSVEDVSLKALGYGMDRDRFFADDVLEVEQRIGEAVERAREQSLPTLVEVRTYRFRGHSMSDPAKYRTQARARGAQEARPAAQGARRSSIEEGYGETRLEAARGERRGRGRRTRSSSPNESPEPGPEVLEADDLRRPVRVVAPSHRRSARLHPMRNAPVPRSPPRGDDRGDGARRPRLSHGRRGRPLPGRLQGQRGDAREVRAEARHRHAHRRGGVRRHRHRRGDGRPPADHRVHDLELQRRRVRPDPEQRGEGAADVAAASSPARSSSAGPNASARQVGSQHSHAMEHFYAHVPGLKVVAPAFPADAKGLLKAAIRDDNPVLVMESETLYAREGRRPRRADTSSRSGKAQIVRAGTDVTIVAYSRMTHVALEAAARAREGGRLRPRSSTCASLRPLDEDTIVASVERRRTAASSCTRGGRTAASAPRSPTACSASRSTRSTRRSCA